jgi:hypothetical protein
MARSPIPEAIFAIEAGKYGWSLGAKGPGLIPHGHRNGQIHRKIRSEFVMMPKMNA